MKKLLLVSLISALVVISVLPVFAVPEDSLQLQVTPKTLVSVTISPSTVDFGTLVVNQESAYPVGISVNNDGSVVEDIDIRGTGAQYDSGETIYTWNLSDDSNGPNQFMLKISKDNWSTVTNLSSTYKDFIDPLSANTNQEFNLKILMPETTSAYGEYTANIYVRATQSGG